MNHDYTLHLPPDLIENLGGDFMADDTPLEAVLADDDAELAEFIRYCRADEPAPLDLAARLMERGYDVDAIEASIHL